MRLKPIEWKPRGDKASYGKHFDSKGIQIDVTPGSSRKGCKWYWFLTAGDCGGDYGESFAYDLSGSQPTEQEAVTAAEQALLEYLMSFLEPDNETSQDDVAARQGQ